MKHPLEVLAPAGNREALDRAVAAGADAVYLGYAAFSARAGAGNFDARELREAVRFAHLYHARVYVTVNTLVKDSELPEVLEVLRLLDDLRVDGVLVQDLGVLALARACFPDLPIHASTQMAIHNATGARWCREQGIRRVVLARECPLEEIRLAAREGVEIEVFGHGAQCVAVSGQCLFSSMIGSRSGNRGRCAQPCRLTYTYRGKTAAWLSPRDVCLRGDLPLLADAGACSVKLEGRLKRPEYVAIVTDSYRRGADEQPFTPEEKQGLLQIFQRGGFMRGYAMGAEDAGVICPERVNHGGVPIGGIEAVAGGMARMRASRPLHDGDGLQIRGASGDQEMIYAGPEVPAGAVALLRLRPDMRVRAGDEVVRLTDAGQLEQARAMPLPPLAADMALFAIPGRRLSLTVADDEDSVVTVTGDIVSPAEKRAMTVEDARRSLGKTGDTPFALRDLTVSAENAFVPVSALNSLRREALDKLAEARAEAFARQPGRALEAPHVTLPRGDAPTTIVVRTLAQYESVKHQDARIVWYPEDFREDGLANMPDGAWLHLPMACEEATLRMLHRFVTAHAHRIGGVVLGSVGQLGLDWPVPIGAGEGIPVMNRRAARLLFDAGCQFATASNELSAAELETLMEGHPPLLVPAYGRAQLMLLHHCPARTYLGLDSGHSDCRLCDLHAADALEGASLIDRRGYAFPLLRQRLPEGCLVRLMNSLPTDILHRARAAGWAPLITLTDESAFPPPDGPATSAHWNRPVE